MVGGGGATEATELHTLLDFLECTSASVDAATSNRVRSGFAWHLVPHQTTFAPSRRAALSLFRVSPDGGMITRLNAYRSARSMTTRADGCCGSSAVRPAHARGEDRRGHVHQRGTGPRRDPQLRRRRLRIAPPEVQGRPARILTQPERRDIKEIAKSRPVEHGLPFSTWSLAELAELADFLVAEGGVDDFSHEGLRVLLR